MSIMKAMLLVMTSALLFAILGGATGYGLGILVPGYYRGLYGGRGPYDEPGFAPREIDPVQMGIGLGVTQGFVGGIVVGLILVFLLTRGQRSRQVLEL